MSLFSRLRRLMADGSRWCFGPTSREASLEQSLVDQGARVSELTTERNEVANQACELANERNAYQQFTGGVCAVYRKSAKIAVSPDDLWADHTLGRRICDYFEALSENHLARAIRLEEQEKRVRELQTVSERLQAERDDAESKSRDNAQMAGRYLEQKKGYREFTLGICDAYREISGVTWDISEGLANTTLDNEIVTYFKSLAFERDDARRELEHTKQLLLDAEKHAAKVTAQRDSVISERDQAWKAFNDRESEFKAELATATQYGANMNADLNFARGEIAKLANEKARLVAKLDRLEDGNYVAQFNKMSREVHEWAISKGWWDERVQTVNHTRGVDFANTQVAINFIISTIQSSLIALIHSELSEAIEAIRHGNPPDDKIPEFSGLEAELADTVIRIHDMAGAYNLRVGEAIEAKMAFNQTREYKHGGKVV